MTIVDDDIFADGFEDGNTSAWISAIGNARCVSFRMVSYVGGTASIAVRRTGDASIELTAAVPCATFEMESALLENLRKEEIDDAAWSGIRNRSQTSRRGRFGARHSKGVT